MQTICIVNINVKGLPAEYLLGVVVVVPSVVMFRIEGREEARRLLVDNSSRAPFISIHILSHLCIQLVCP